MKYTKIEQKYKSLIPNDKLNTSYPITREMWGKYKQEKELRFNEKDMCFYLHIPFCLSLCKFCEYVKYKKPEVTEQKKYIEILKKDVLDFIEKHPDITLHGLDIGGGTPTCLDEEVFEDLLKFVKEVMQRVKVSDDFEPSIEGTFITINERKIKAIKEAGINRISLGIQTVNKKFLNDNDRALPAIAKIFETFALCQKYGIEKVNIDLMYGLKNQTQKDLKANMLLIKLLRPEHVTIYEFRTNILNISEFKTKGELFKQYKYLYKKLMHLKYFGSFGQNTFSQNYYDLGLSSYLRHRMIDFTSYKGFGISAQSKSDEGVSYNIGKNFNTFEECLSNGTFSSQDTYILPKEEMLAKFVAVSGYYGKIKLSVMEEILKENPMEYFKDQIEFLLAKKLIKIKNGNICITRKGFKHYGAILALFYPKNYKE